MFKIDLLGLKEGINPLRRSFSGDIPLFRQLDVELAGDGSLVGSIEKRGSNLYRVVASISFPVSLSCRRCLEDFRGEIRTSLTIVGLRKDRQNDEPVDGEDVLHLGANQEEIDLEDLLREHILLNLPAYPLCSEGCKGLCVGCGADLNRENCSCVS